MLRIVATILTLAGIGLMIAKWVFGMEQIGYWTLLFLVPGIVLGMIASRREKGGA